MNHGPWLFKDEWLALAHFDPTLNIQEYSFNTMNIWVRIHDIPSILMDSDSIPIQIGSSLGSLFSTVTKNDTRCIDGNMSTYLRLGCCINVTNPIRRCVFIGGSSSSKKRCMLQYERLPMLYYGCGLIGHLATTCKVNHSKLHNFEQEATEDSKHNSSDRAFVANVPTNVEPNLTDPLEVFLNDETFFEAIEVLTPTPLMVVKPNGGTIVEDSSTERITSNTLESAISPTTSVQRGTKRRSPMVDTSKIEKTRIINPIPKC
ncbi:hypothetical protein V6N13_025021 [Hibiscus sabdariffa]|uniref:DUF4283 domain-containing protein n=1 Tax=Hibiscus sabdariffa TaxID=183260 RepID=A0ABR2BD32_9ROSI